MNIVILSGSPRKGGNTQQLAQAFAQGAVVAGHQVEHFDTAAMNIAPCAACYHCRQEQTAGGCLVQDDMAQIYQAVNEAELLVLATPLYYFGFSAQIKTAIDRLFAINESLKGSGSVKRMMLLAVCGDEEVRAMDGLVENYRLICDYLGLENLGEMLAIGVYDKGEIAGHPALQDAFDKAASL